jgi:hypothetical protein
LEISLALDNHIDGLRKMKITAENMADLFKPSNSYQVQVIEFVAANSEVIALGLNEDDISVYASVMQDDPFITVN